jgi:hypothetical protein
VSGLRELLSSPLLPLKKSLGLATNPMGSVLATSCWPDVLGYPPVKPAATVPLGQRLGAGGTVLATAERKNNLSSVLLDTFVLAAS